jgi:hypothetical protein
MATAGMYVCSTLVMLVVLAFLTIDSLAAIRAGGRQVPAVLAAMAVARIRS